MNSSRLSREVDITKRNIEGLIDDLVSEIEELEKTIDDLQDENDNLREQLSNSN